MKHTAWMPFYVGDYLRDTMGLSRDEHGSYVLLIMAYWANGGPLEDDDKALRIIAGCPEAEWARTKGLMHRFFDVSGGRWRHKRIDDELARSKSAYDAQKKRTRAATLARKSNLRQNVTKNVTKNVTLDVAKNDTTNVAFTQSQSQSHIQSKHSCLSTPLEPKPTSLGTHTQAKATEKSSGNGVETSFNWLSGELRKFYHRPAKHRLSYEEESGLVDLARREGIGDEWECLKDFRSKVEARYFPQSIAALCRDWDKTLDRARSHEPDKPTKSLEKKLLHEALAKATNL